MKKFVAVVLALGLTGCAATPPLGHVIPGENGIYEVIASGHTADGALASALHSAEVTCRKRQQRHIVMSQHSVYRGVLPEGSERILKKADEVVVAAGGRPLPRLSSDDDYRLSMQFRCER